MPGSTFFIKGLVGAAVAMGAVEAAGAMGAKGAVGAMGAVGGTAQPRLLISYAEGACR